jgi:DNA-binding XRE family transcriptional regulator
MDRSWTRLGQKLKAARAELGMEQKDAAAQIGVKRGALHNVESGVIRKVTPTVLAYARLVGWQDGSVELVLDGGDPVVANSEPPAVATPELSTAEASDLSVRVQQALKEGPLIDSRVTEVVTPSGRVKATIVVRGEEGTPVEQLLDVLRTLRIDVSIEDS